MAFSPRISFGVSSELSETNYHQVGIISDTHGLVRPEALEALAQCELIIHAGDIGTPQVLDALQRIAPVRAVRGNVDHGDWTQSLPTNDVVQLGEVYLYVLHNVGDLDLDPVAAGFHAVISGHSHEPRAEERDGVLYLNPGSAGPRRFTLPIAVARLRISSGRLEPELVTHG